VVRRPIKPLFLARGSRGGGRKCKTGRGSPAHVDGLAAYQAMQAMQAILDAGSVSKIADVIADCRRSRGHEATNVSAVGVWNPEVWAHYVLERKKKDFPPPPHFPPSDRQPTGNLINSICCSVQFCPVLSIRVLGRFDNTYLLLSAYPAPGGSENIPPITTATKS
jgi:hypothetical protein